MSGVRVTITGIQEAQDANNRMEMALKPSGAFGRSIKYATAQMHRYSVIYTHVDTGSLRASHRWTVRGLEGEVFIDPSTRNPRSGQRPSEYGGYEHQRGGSHAFYDRAVRDKGDEVAKRALKMLKDDLE